jgi:peptide-methionine (S)-S-oxide reductase
MRRLLPALARVLLSGFVAVSGSSLAASARPDPPVPAPAVDAPLAPAGAPARTAVLSGGCFWGIQAVYQHVRGVTKAVSGYAGGGADTAHYEMVGTGRTGHAESVQITYDPSRVTYGQLLRVFFSVAHDPTTLNRQGPDEGTQYRSAIFFQDADQERIARAYIAQLDRGHIFHDPIVTQVVKLPAFYAAEAYHQDYFNLHPREPYIVINDAPKVANLRAVFPDLYTGR